MLFLRIYFSDLIFFHEIRLSDTDTQHLRIDLRGIIMTGDHQRPHNQAGGSEEEFKTLN